MKDMPDFEYSASSLDIDKDSIEVWYYTAIAGEQRLFRNSHKSMDVWAFIVKQKAKSENYIYIFYKVISQKYDLECSLLNCKFYVKGQDIK